MTEKTLGIAKAFVEAQKEFGQVLKKADNPFFKSKYADLASVHDAVIDALHNHDIALLQKTHECDNGVKIETVFMHVSGEQISGGVLFVPAQQDAQKYGSALTYARRYSLLSACGLPAEDDDGNSASNKSIAAKLPQKAEPVKKY